MWRLVSHAASGVPSLLAGVAAGRQFLVAPRCRTGSLWRMLSRISCSTGYRTASLVGSGTSEDVEAGSH